MEWKKYFRCRSCGDLYTNYFWQTLRMRGCINMLTLLTVKCGFGLPHHSSPAWSLCILQTSSKQIRARLTHLGLIRHALFCPDFVWKEGRLWGPSLHLCGISAGPIPSWSYYVVATPGYSVSKNPRHFHNICTDQLWRPCKQVQHFLEVSEGLVVQVWISCEARADKFNVSQSSGLVVHM